MDALPMMGERLACYDGSWSGKYEVYLEVSHFRILLRQHDAFIQLFKIPIQVLFLICQQAIDIHGVFIEYEDTANVFGQQIVDKKIHVASLVSDAVYCYTQSTENIGANSGVLMEYARRLILTDIINVRWSSVIY
ncbi:hypothetical protein BDC45DRAFT_538568 [Circinella umbellata]|nr:hypothetical protein BDC45DRAFT_538568 [Circinella umbellata]